jgi:hypothetical protein
MRYRVYKTIYTYLFPVNSFVIFPLLFLTLTAGDTNVRKQVLWQEFEWAHMRELPASMAGYNRLREFDIVFQQPYTYEPDTQFPHTYIVGMYKPSLGRFERTHLLSRVNPFTEYALVKAVSDYYQTDTTYLDVLLRNRKNTLESVVFRKAKPENLLTVGEEERERSEFVMWKKERILIKDGHVSVRLIEQWNKQLFE